ncbi:uncharacterized protein KRP23_7416 [Phytophthora ramorum]|uniref:uncharacterized protein n=1 Tax=Phytophthora ramorum TaxID=164328 RepID=UPI0030B79492|nr:hypothetical protein KRP23_7416 [Phytophthora ramorum]
MRRTTLGPVSSAQLNTRTSVLRHPSTRVSVPNKSSASERQSIGIVSRRVSAAAGPNARHRIPPRLRGRRTQRSAAAGRPAHLNYSSVCGPPQQHVRFALFRVGPRRHARARPAAHQR